MAVGFDSQSFKDLTGTGGTWTHTPVGTPRGFIVGIAQTAGSRDVINSVSFGGATLTRVATNGYATTSGGEPGQAWLYFKGTGVAASGTVNIVASTLGGTMTGWAVAFTANQAWTEVAASALANGSTVANPAATIHATSGDSGVAFGVMFSGVDVPSSAAVISGYTALTGSTTGGRDFGSQSAVAAYGLSSGATISVGWTASGDDVAVCAALVREVVPSIGTMPIVNSAVQVY